MRCLFIGALSAALPILLTAQTVPDHQLLDIVLDQYVQGPLVEYGALKADRDGLDRYLSELSQTEPEALLSGSPAVQLAFWINAYNACALKLVIDNYPIKKRGFPGSLLGSLKGVPSNSIRQISDTWSRRFCPVAGSERSLDEIEHEVLRPMGEPRIHFALNCASRSCPLLAGSAYTADELDSQLDEAVQRFVSDSAQYRLVRGDSPQFVVSKILDWYKDDFGGTEGVVEFLLQHVEERDAEYLRTHSAVGVEYADYDWTLNDTASLSSGG
jgi:hypothetical protein